LAVFLGTKRFEINWIGMGLAAVTHTRSGSGKA
jgi:hypothetical protein